MKNRQLSVRLWLFVSICAVSVLLIGLMLNQPQSAAPHSTAVDPGAKPGVPLPQLAIQDSDTSVTLTQAPAVPLPVNIPTILLTDKPIVPSPLTVDIRNLPYVPASPETKPEFESEPAKKIVASVDSSSQPAEPLIVLGTMPAPALSFNAMDYNNNGNGHPPDTNGDVGINHYMEAVNTSIGIYTKTTGAKVTAFTFNSFWSGAGTVARRRDLSRNQSCQPWCPCYTLYDRVYSGAPCLVRPFGLPEALPIFRTIQPAPDKPPRGKCKHSVNLYTV